MKRLAAVLLLATTATASSAPLPSSDEPGPAGMPPGPPPASAQVPRLSQLQPLSPPGAVAPSAQPGEPLPGPEATPSVLAQTVVGGMAGVLGGLLGGAIGYRLDIADHSGGEFDGLGGLVLGSAIGLTAATTAGVMLVGHDQDHDASIALTWLGTVGGGIVGGLVSSRSESPALIGIAVVTGTALGGALMHNVSRTRSSPATVRVVPFAGGGGFGLSLVGTAP
jgi:hypothetical protein